jgi:D-alanyl-lipoteichoic acid acyltransferase DltB (MBOAT superfamily)
VTLNLVLPLGISYYVFQKLSYVMMSTGAISQPARDIDPLDSPRSWHKPIQYPSNIAYLTGSER